MGHIGKIKEINLLLEEHNILFESLLINKQKQIKCIFDPILDLLDLNKFTKI